MIPDPLRAALLAALGRHPTPARRRTLATLLRQFADEQEQIADADARSGHILRRAALDSRKRGAKGGRPKGSGARFVRVEPRATGYGAHVHLGRALWQELGEPARLDLQRIGGALRMTPCEASVGYSFTRGPNGMPKCTIGEDALQALGLLPGRYPATIEVGAVVAPLR